METVSLIFTILTSIGTIAIAIVAYVVSRRAYLFQTQSTLIATINSFNALALTDDKCLVTFHRLIFNEEPKDLDESRETWAIYSFLNNRQLHFFSAATRHTSKDYLAEDGKILSQLLQNQHVLKVLQTGGYDPKFIKHCLSSLERYGS